MSNRVRPRNGKLPAGVLASDDKPLVEYCRAALGLPEEDKGILTASIRMAVFHRSYPRYWSIPAIAKALCQSDPEGRDFSWWCDNVTETIDDVSPAIDLFMAHVGAVHRDLSDKVEMIEQTQSSIRDLPAIADFQRNTNDN